MYSSPDPKKIPEHRESQEGSTCTFTDRRACLITHGLSGDSAVVGTDVSESSYSQVIRRCSPYDGVERPLGEALARGVVNECDHGDCAVHPGWRQLHQLAVRKIKGLQMFTCYFSKLSLEILLKVGPQCF